MHNNADGEFLAFSAMPCIKQYSMFGVANVTITCCETVRSHVFDAMRNHLTNDLLERNKELCQNYISRQALFRSLLCLSCEESFVEAGRSQPSSIHDLS